MRRSHLALLPVLAVLVACAAPASPDDAAFSSTSGLYWQRCAIGSEWDGDACTGAPEALTWSEAVEACEARGPGWRLPTLDEVGMLLGDCSAPGEAARCAPCELSGECSTVLADGTDLEWTADPVGEDALLVDLGTGVVAYEDVARPLSARCVTDVR
ncbi:MAG: DUF1566 domain-containing protein [Myxococcales bacterium]|nr:DUF1566 domain-containing protein [Myxococcales bacterium]